MIIREVPLDNAWYRVAGTWFIALLAINCVLWPTYDHYRYDLNQLRWIAYSMPIGSVFFWTIGRFFSEPTRVLSFVAIIGLFGYLPLLTALLLPLILLIVLPDEQSRWPLALLLISVIMTMYWIFGEIKALKERIFRKKFLNREFSVMENCIHLNRAPTIELDEPRIADGALVSKIARFFPKLIFLLPLAYPVQRLFYDANGVPAVLLFLAVLGTPLALHVIERLSCGFYLWIYTVRKVELQHGKRVLLAPRKEIWSTT
jgi:hypothetical protein